ncbi:spore maturation protein A [Clostridium sp. W14A]|uniref:Spore maturation protein A n=1 Tax=Caproicibacter fermentans TaxID=2576756 RepID=A0A7G8TGD1_9FIRM|nr:nucleoside recognition domain-containing protein [Caproicibacter fermentans]OCN01923.1 spore maturation protein A [Clostridium sp. W14A]QNK42672.1 spore maturation protein A [Caproicibacter fermentans]
MLNYIWAGMILFSVFCAAVTGRMEPLSNAVLSGASGAVTLVLSMTGMMCAWTGLMKIADEGGLTLLLAKALNPLMRRLFPECKPGGPAVKAMCMNITANLLGLGNAATPLGIAAMQELKKNNPTQTADNSMVTFVVLNTASIQLIPTTLGILRAQYGSAAPFEILPAVWVTSVCSVIVGLTAAKLMEGLLRG